MHDDFCMFEVRKMFIIVNIKRIIAACFKYNPKLVRIQRIIKMMMQNPFLMI